METKVDAKRTARARRPAVSALFLGPAVPGHDLQPVIQLDSSPVAPISAPPFVPFSRVPDRDTTVLPPPPSPRTCPICLGGQRPAACSVSAARTTRSHVCLSYLTTPPPPLHLPTHCGSSDPLQGPPLFILLLYLMHVVDHSVTTARRTALTAAAAAA